MDPFEVIGAFVDGERVDPDALKTALATDEGRQYLIDIAALREMTVGDMAISGNREMGRLGDRAIGRSGDRGIGRSRDRSATPQQRWVAPIAAAAAVVIALTGGYLIGHRSAVSQGAGATSMTATEPAPVPTSVIKLEPGVDWHEQTTRN